jgi:hypothetical protein
MFEHEFTLDSNHPNMITIVGVISLIFLLSRSLKEVLNFIPIIEMLLDRFRR